MRISNYPQEFATRAATVLGSSIETSITMRQHGLTVRAGSSSDASARCDQAEARVDSGPCVSAMEELSAQVVPQIDAAAPWPEWRDQANREGFVSAAAVPAVVAPGVVIALNLYTRAPDPWTAQLLTSADSFAQLVASSVRLRFELADLEDTVSGFYRNLSDTLVAERAVGAIMQTNACSEEDARQILESASQQQHVEPREVAETILRALVLGGEPERTTDQAPAGPDR